MLDLLRYLAYLLPVLPILILLRLLMNLPRRSLRKRTTVWHEIGVIIFAFYIVAVCSVTLNLHSLLRGDFQASQHYNLKPFAGLSIMWNNPDRQYAIVNVLGNIAMFAPLGFMLPLLWRNWSGFKVFFAGMAFSVLIETVQFFTGRGTDIDDVILNTLGAIVGYILFSLLRRIAPRLVKAAKVK